MHNCQKMLKISFFFRQIKSALEFLQLGDEVHTYITTGNGHPPNTRKGQSWQLYNE